MQTFASRGGGGGGGGDGVTERAEYADTTSRIACPKKGFLLLFSGGFG